MIEKASADTPAAQGTAADVAPGTTEVGQGPGQPASPTTVPVYRALAEHQLAQTDGWLLRNWMTELHRWKEIFEFEFKLELGDVALRLTSLPRNCLGWFCATSTISASPARSPSTGDTS